MRWSSLLCKRSQVVLGYVEHADRFVVRGWAWETSRPDSRVCLDVFIHDVYAGCARTGRFRADLSVDGIGDGCHAFVFHVPHFMRDRSITPHDVQVTTTGSPPIQLVDIDAARRPTDGIALRQPASFFGPLLERLAATPPEVPASEAAERRQVDLLLSQPDPPRTAFARHIAHKYAGVSPSADSKDFLTWYLEDYGIERGPARVPLSATDIEELAELSKHDLDEYHWAINEARRLYVEDCVTEPGLRTRLDQVPITARLFDFPLSRFMREFRSRNDLLARRKATTTHGRIQIYCIIMMYALHDPHYLAYMPPRWLAAMLDTTEGQSLFERVQVELVGAASQITPKVFVSVIESQGFDLSSRTFRGTSYGKHRLSHGGQILSEANPVDVQLIGPFRRSLGLAESCRRIAVALKASGHAINLVNFEIGNASAVAEPNVPLEKIRTSRINLLHLNADELPEAVAYLPDCFSRSRTILVPYWELNRPARVHDLGIALVDEIWATSHYLAEVLAGSSAPVALIGMGLDDRPWPSREEGRALMKDLGVSTDAFVFLTTSDAHSWAQRKNVLGTIDAFQAAFSETEAKLVVKTRHIMAPLSAPQQETWAAVVSRCHGDPRIVMLDVDLPVRQHQALIAGCDCLASLHRAEGLGLDILDALAHGTPVVSTAYSGNMDFCDNETAWLVDFDLVAVSPGDYAFVEPGHVWADPRHGSAVAALRRVLSDAPGRAARSRTAHVRLEAQRSPAAFARRLGDLVAERLANLQ